MLDGHQFNHSYFKLSAGLVRADLIVWDDTVMKATSKDRTAHTIKMPAPMLMG